LGGARKCSFHSQEYSSSCNFSTDENGLSFVYHFPGHTPVRKEVRACNKACAITVEKEGDYLGDILRLSDAADRVLGVSSRD
jgi:hypothetical protein